jgi:hypothetical protein
MRNLATVIILRAQCKETDWTWKRRRAKKPNNRFSQPHESSSLSQAGSRERLRHKNPLSKFFAQTKQKRSLHGLSSLGKKNFKTHHHTRFSVGVSEFGKQFDSKHEKTISANKQRSVL